MDEGQNHSSPAQFPRSPAELLHPSSSKKKAFPVELGLRDYSVPIRIPHRSTLIRVNLVTAMNFCDYFNTQARAQKLRKKKIETASPPQGILVAAAESISVRAPVNPTGGGVCKYITSFHAPVRHTFSHML